MQKTYYIEWHCQIPRICDSRNLPSRQDGVERSFLDETNNLSRLADDCTQQHGGYVSIKVETLMPVRWTTARTATAMLAVRLRYGLIWWLARKLRGASPLPDSFYSGLCARKLALGVGAR